MEAHSPPANDSCGILFIYLIIGWLIQFLSLPTDEETNWKRRCHAITSLTESLNAIWFWLIFVSFDLKMTFLRHRCQSWTVQPWPKRPTTASICQFALDVSVFARPDRVATGNRTISDARPVEFGSRMASIFFRVNLSHSTGRHFTEINSNSHANSSIIRLKLEKRIGAIRGKRSLSATRMKPRVGENAQRFKL